MNSHVIGIECSYDFIINFADMSLNRGVDTGTDISSSELRVCKRFRLFHVSGFVSENGFDCF